MFIPCGLVSKPKDDITSTYAFRYTNHTQLTSSKQKALPLSTEYFDQLYLRTRYSIHSPYRKLVILIREAGWPSLDLDTKQRRTRIRHVNNTMVQIRARRTIYHYRHHDEIASKLNSAKHIPLPV